MYTPGSYFTRSAKSFTIRSWMAWLSMTVTVPGVSATGAGRKVADTVTESRNVSGSSSACASPPCGAAAACSSAGCAAGSCCAPTAAAGVASTSPSNVGRVITAGAIPAANLMASPLHAVATVAYTRVGEGT